MNRFVFLCIQALMLRTAFSLPTPGNAYLSNLNNAASISQTPFTSTFSETNILSNNAINNSIMPSGLNANAINNNVLASAASGVPNPAISNIQVSPVISELVPSLQYGDINMVGDLPIGGTIKVSGCFPVYGMISVDGNVPSSGTAVVSESIGNQVIDVVNKCANQYFS